MEEKINLSKISPNSGELDQIIKLYIACFNDEDKGENWTLKSAGEYFQTRLNEGSTFYVAKDKSAHILGVIMGSNFKDSFISKEVNVDITHAYYICLVATSKKHRRLKLASKLMNLMETDLKNLKYQNLIVRCRVENTPVQGLFYKHKFKDELRYESTLGGVTCERLILTKSLNA